MPTVKVSVGCTNLGKHRSEQTACVTADIPTGTQTEVPVVVVLQTVSHATVEPSYVAKHTGTDITVPESAEYIRIGVTIESAASSSVVAKTAMSKVISVLLLLFKNRAGTDRNGEITALDG